MFNINLFGERIHIMSETAENRINDIETTDERLTGRGGLTFFVRYLTNIGIFSLLSDHFGDLRKSSKGLPVIELFKQIFCWFADGTSRHISFFDHLAKDSGYAGTIETSPGSMASSHTVKRFCKSFTIFKVWIFRKILQKLFIWRLRIQQPDVIRIDIDTMVMDNDETDVRHGVGPTYKKTKGFQPLQVTWERFVIDAVFRGGIRHSNYKDTVIRTVKHLTDVIRREYRSDAVIVLTCDTGFFDQKNFKEFENRGIFYISGAPLTEDIRNITADQTPENFGRLEKKDRIWEYSEYGYKCDAWDKYRRFVYCRPLYENGQMLLNFERNETLLVTNIRPDAVTGKTPGTVRDMVSPEGLIPAYHRRGNHELINRGLKDFGFEELPFKRFPPNAALYYMMLIAFFLFETFKEDALHTVIPLQSYAVTVRRVFIDIAAKVVSHSGRITVKFCSAVSDRLKLKKIWETCNSPPCPAL